MLQKYFCSSPHTPNPDILGATGFAKPGHLTGLCPHCSMLTYCLALCALKKSLVWGCFATLLLSAYRQTPSWPGLTIQGTKITKEKIPAPRLEPGLSSSSPEVPSRLSKRPKTCRTPERSPQPSARSPQLHPAWSVPAPRAAR